MRYRVDYSGYAYVEAESEEEAEEVFWEDGEIYDEKEVTAVEEVEEFYVTVEECVEDA